MNLSRRQLEAFGEPLGDSVTRKVAGRIIYGGGGSTSTTKNEIAPFMEEAAKESLGKARALTDTTANPYQAYTGDRIAEFDPLQNKFFSGVEALRPSENFGTASNIANTVSQRALDMGYNTGQFGNQFNAPGQYETGQFGPQNVQAPQLNQYGMGPAERVTSESFNRPGSAEAYMSPYMQNVVEIQQREAQRAADIAGTQRGASAVKSGAFGGSRQAIMDAEAARNLATQKGDIQATGQQAAFQNAQQQFNAEQQRQIAAQQANQAAGLTVGQQNLGAQLGIQQLGAGQDIQAQLANQQAASEAQRLREQSRQFGAGQGLTAAQLQAQYGLSAQQAEEASRQFGAGLGLKGLESALSASGRLGELGTAGFSQEVDRLGALQKAGGQRQTQEQSKLQTDYEEYLKGKKYPYEQLEFMSNIMRGTPYGTTSSTYTPGPSAGQQLLGLGTSLGGAYLMGPAGGAAATKFLRGKKGGLMSTQKMKSGGLSELAISML